MHDIEPYYRWRDDYVAAKDARSPFYGKVNSEFQFTNKVYNYYIHPQWDEFGSSTLYAKVIFADYDLHYAILELIGEWNDCLHNDVMLLKRHVIDPMLGEGVHKFILICENVLNFHGDDNCYYEEWYDDVKEHDGWICILNSLDHVSEEMEHTHIHHYVNLGGAFNDFNWRPHKPKNIFGVLDAVITDEILELPDGYGG